MSNWITPGPDGAQEFWFKMTNLHDQPEKHLETCLNTGIVRP